MTFSVQAIENKPNVIVILIDDAGFNDFGFQGSKDLQTPHIDKIAKGGMTFTKAYVSSNVCSPSRAGLLTGRYQQRFGMEKNMTRFPADFKRGILKDEYTIAQHFQAAGYNTAAIGKWHVGFKKEYHPNAKGFDYFFGLLGGHRTYFKHDTNENDKASEYRFLERNGKRVPENHSEYVTDLLTNDAINYIKNHKEKPFFMYLSYTAVHTPMDAESHRLKNVPTTIINETRRKLYAMTESLDENIGKLSSTLNQLNIADNTIVVFLNDNGGPDSNGSSNGKLRGGKGSHYEGGLRVPFAIKWPQNIRAGTIYDKRVSSLDLLPTLLAATNVNYLPNQKPLDGVNLLPYILNENPLKPHNSLFFKFWSGRAHIKGDWKWLIAKVKQPDGTKLPTEFLFNLKDDPYEKHNLIHKYPQIYKALKAEWDNWDRDLIKL